MYKNRQNGLENATISIFTTLKTQPETKEFQTRQNSNRPLRKWVQMNQNHGNKGFQSLK